MENYLSVFAYAHSNCMTIAIQSACECILIIITHKAGKTCVAYINICTKADICSKHICPASTAILNKIIAIMLHYQSCTGKICPIAYGNIIIRKSIYCNSMPRSIKRQNTVSTLKQIGIVKAKHSAPIHIVYNF